MPQRRRHQRLAFRQNLCVVTSLSSYTSRTELPAPAPARTVARWSVRTLLFFGLGLMTVWSMGVSVVVQQLGIGSHLVMVFAATVAAATVLGLLMMRCLVDPVRQLTQRAEEMAQRYAGRSVTRRGNEFDALFCAFDAMTDALLAHSERLKHAHLSELQNSLELQRQYALMRLLRGLAAAANESDSVDQALERAVEEIGEYLDWPVGRAALIEDGDDALGGLPTRSIWFVRERARFAEFMQLSQALGPTRRVSGLSGRAYMSGMPHWVSDLSQLSDFRRRDVALACGLKSGVVIPVVARGHIMALIEFFADHRVEASAEMLELVEAIGVELSRVAERHRAERDLRASEAEARRLALVASRTEKAVILLDVAGRVQWVNEAFTHWTACRWSRRATRSRTS